MRPFTLSHWGGAELIDIDENGVLDFSLGFGAVGSVEPWTTTFAEFDPSSSAYGAVGQTFSVPADPLVASPEAYIYLAGHCGGHDCIPPTLLVPVGTNAYPVAFERDGAVHAAWHKIWVGWRNSELIVDYQQIAWEDVPGAPIVLGWVDCDGDSVLDDEEIAADPSLDCNGNHLLDACEGDAREGRNDCDSDGIPDVCAILTGAAGDCNVNGLPDSCEIESGAVHDCNADGIPDEYQAGAAPMEDGVSLELDGYWSRASVPHLGLEMPTEEITIELWQKVEAPAVQTTFRLDWSEDNRCMAHVQWTDGVVYWDFGDWSNGGRLQYTPPEPIVGTWQHFALQASASGGFMRIYRNGVLEASTSQSDTLTPVDQPLVFNSPSSCARPCITRTRRA